MSWSAATSRRRTSLGDVLEIKIKNRNEKIMLIYLFPSTKTGQGHSVESFQGPQCDFTVQFQLLQKWQPGILSRDHVI